MDNRLFKMKNEMGKIGQVGNFVPNYEESEFVLNELFPKDKNIFAISIEGSECIYFLNLLIQYGYDPAKLFNIGGFSHICAANGFCHAPDPSQYPCQYRRSAQGHRRDCSDTGWIL